MNKKKNPLITIVTVVYNDVEKIEKTILSVINQSYKNIEYIIVDGGSKDGTLKVIRKYRKFISKLISEKDNGIYDAMNKGIEFAKGDWINFLNSGDTFVTDKIIEKIPFKKNENCVLVYGSSKIFSFSGRFLKILKAYKMNKLNLTLFGTRVACHQAIFYNTKIKFKYPKKYRHAGELFSYFEYLKYGRATRLDLVICNYYLGGLGTIEINTNRKEQWEVLKSQVSIFWFLFFPKYLYSNIMYRLIK